METPQSDPPLDREFIDMALRVAEERRANQQILQTAQARHRSLERAGTGAALVLGMMTAAAHLAQAAAIREEPPSQKPQAPAALQFMENPSEISPCFGRAVLPAVQRMGASLDRGKEPRYSGIPRAIAQLQEATFRAVPRVPSAEDVPVVCVFADDVQAIAQRCGIRDPLGVLMNRAATVVGVTLQLEITRNLLAPGNDRLLFATGGIPPDWFCVGIPGTKLRMEDEAPAGQEEPPPDGDQQDGDDKDEQEEFKPEGDTIPG